LVELLKEHQYQAFTQKAERDAKKHENLVKMIKELEEEEK
jgi:hypothetical protein